MTYYYAVNGQQTGPVTEEQLRAMVASGSIPADSLIWREGMPQWLPYSSVLGAVGIGQAVVECSVCHQTFPADQTIQYGTERVCAGCKPKFIQGLREGAVVMSNALVYAGFWRRFFAKLLDTILLFGVGLLLALAIPAVGNSAAAQATINIFGNVLGLAYSIIFLGWRGQTLGKMALKVKVVNPDGTPIGWGKAVGRPFAEILSGCTIFIGYLISIFDDEKRTLHDRLANTRVIKID